MQILIKIIKELYLNIQLNSYVQIQNSNCPQIWGNIQRCHLSDLWRSRTLYLSRPPSQRTGTRPPSCIYLDNCLYMHVKSWKAQELESLAVLGVLAWVRLQPFSRNLKKCKQRHLMSQELIKALKKHYKTRNFQQEEVYLP